MDLQNKRLEIGAKIEKLTLMLQRFDCDQNGNTQNLDACAIAGQIDDLETELSKTWTN